MASGVGLPDSSRMFLPIFLAVFGSIGWIMIFLETYMHLNEKTMSKKERIKESATQATIMTVFLVVMSYFALQFIMAEVLK